MATLPFDIILSNILPRLPVISLIRFKCVSKAFLSEISSPKFIKKHHHNAISSNSNRLLIRPAGPKGIYVYDLDAPQSPPLFRCPYPKVTFYDVSFISIVAICESYLLIGCGLTQLGNVFLLNPSTRTYREIPEEFIPCVSPNVLYGLWHCLDEFKDEHRVVRFVNYHWNANLELQVVVYNTTTDMWKEIERKIVDDTFISRYGNAPVLVQNHLLHLLFFDLGPHEGDYIKRIGCFDMKAEQWANDVPLPDVLWDENGFELSLSWPYNLEELDDQLCFTGYNVIESSFEMWVMKEYAVKESWVKLMCIKVPSDLDSSRLWIENCHPLAYRTGSPHEVLYIQGCYHCKMYWYNLRDKEAIEAEFPPPLDPEHDWHDSLAYVCKGSLLDIPGGQPIRVLLEEEDDEDEEEEDNDDNDFVNF